MRLKRNHVERLQSREHNSLSKVLFLLSLILHFNTAINGQNFVNGDLEAVNIANQSAQIPDSWLSVPFYDISCEATSSPFTTPDLTTISGPFLLRGVFGIPFTGKSFVSGEYGEIPNGHIAQEGIMQKVSGFERGCMYRVSFMQAFIPMHLYHDSGGMWKVFLDSNLLGISTPTFSSAEYDDPNLKWEKRSISFVAQKETYLIKFLPFDNDANIFEWQGVRMCIDNIILEKTQLIKSFDFISDTICIDKRNALTTPYPKLPHIWQDGSDDPIFFPELPGKYWVNVENGCHTYSDTTVIDSLPTCYCEIFIPSAFTPNGDFINDIFEVNPKCLYQHFELTIFNKWGEQIFRSNRHDYGWDGMSSGEVVPTGKYTYHIILDSEIQQGSVYLLR